MKFGLSSISSNINMSFFVNRRICNRPSWRFYNITITSLSVVVALVIGTIELVGVLVDRTHLTSGPLVWVADIPLDYAGYAIAGLFVVSWLVALAIWRFGRIEERWTTPAVG